MENDDTVVKISSSWRVGGSFYRAHYLSTFSLKRWRHGAEARIALIARGNLRGMAPAYNLSPCSALLIGIISNRYLRITNLAASRTPHVERQKPNRSTRRCALFICGFISIFSVVSMVLIHLDWRYDTKLDDGISFLDNRSTCLSDDTTINHHHGAVTLQATSVSMIVSRHTYTWRYLKENSGDMDTGCDEYFIASECAWTSIEVWKCFGLWNTRNLKNKRMMVKLIKCLIILKVKLVATLFV